MHGFEFHSYYLRRSFVKFGTILRKIYSVSIIDYLDSFITVRGSLVLFTISDAKNPNNTVETTP